MDGRGPASALRALELRRAGRICRVSHLTYKIGSLAESVGDLGPIPALGDSNRLIHGEPHCGSSRVCVSDISQAGAVWPLLGT
jgi:hypothetical protein